MTTPISQDFITAFVNDEAKNRPADGKHIVVLKKGEIEEREGREGGTYANVHYEFYYPEFNFTEHGSVGLNPKVAWILKRDLSVLDPDFKAGLTAENAISRIQDVLRRSTGAKLEIQRSTKDKYLNHTILRVIQHGPDFDVPF